MFTVCIDAGATTDAANQEAIFEMMKSAPRFLSQLLPVHVDDVVVHLVEGSFLATNMDLLLLPVPGRLPIFA